MPSIHGVIQRGVMANSFIVVSVLVMNIQKLNKFDIKDIQPFKGKYYDYPIVAIDTETIHGKPYTIQFYDGIDDPLLFYINESTITDCFLDYLAAHMRPNLSVWFFFAQFDLPIIFSPTQELFLSDNHSIQLGEFHFDFVTAKTWFADCQYGTERFYIRDAFQYVFRGLDKVAKDLHLEQGKAKKPSYLGEREPDDSERADFEAYAKQDTVVLWHLVNWILSLHRRYDVSLSVSLADLCGKIFRKSFFKPSHTIVVPNDTITLAALQSYHGGKTECYVQTPTLIRDIHEYDLKSAYPWAMVTMPNFFDYEIEHREKIKTCDVQPDGLYQVSGLLSCPYRGLYNHDFKHEKILSHTWVTGYELQGVLSFKEFEGQIHEGYYIHSNRDKENPITEYVWEFFRKKQQADLEKNVTERLWTKLALNALYGKFIARIAEDETPYTEHWRGGVLFNPIMATCITGKLRGYIHEIEHTINCLHTSTDSFITKHPAAHTLFAGVDDLGSLRKEYEGDALIFRRKLYLILEHVNRDCVHDWQENDKDKSLACTKCSTLISKQALHGFYGSAKQLMTMYHLRKKQYTIKKMVRLKEAYRSRDPDLIPFIMQHRQRTLNIDWEAYYELSTM